MTTRVLLDHSVLRDAVIGQWVEEGHEVRWGRRVVRTSVVTMARRPLPPSDQAERIADIQCLPTLRRLALTGRLQCFVSTEIKFEGLRGSNAAAGTIGDLLSAVPMIRAESPVERSFLQSTITLSEYLGRETMRGFCSMLLALRSPQVEFLLERIEGLPEASRRGLLDLARFRALCINAPAKHYPDLFHWWTAEHAGCGYFVTMDRKLVNFATRQCAGILHCKPVRPSELLQGLGVGERDPMPFDQGHLLSYLEALEER